MNKQQGIVLPLTLVIISMLLTIGSMMLIKADTKLQSAVSASKRVDALLHIHSAEQRLFFGMLAGERLPMGYQIGDLFLRTDGEPIKLDNGVHVSLQDLKGLVSLRYIKKVNLVSILRLYVSEKEADEIASSIIRWQSQDNGGYGRQDLFRSMDELLLIDGITPEIYNGTASKPGLRDLTVLNHAIDVNYAVVPNYVLKHVYGLSGYEISRIEYLKVNQRWRELESYLYEIGLGSELTPSTRLRVQYEYNGVRASAEYRIRPGTSMPPPIRMWRFPDYERYFLFKTQDVGD
ncbi:hypothetical protein BZJ17_13145 [Salinivibrio sp. IB574]|uniref:hypothetical protein n=1 Tax=Salinivibrio sp. IB574 TaxID=1909444 RepID=UPI0009898037|nr:hypothetical protein [Salinivibrio sp. IB574]OOF20396.1 hypothetical protein BZJ17_13145 [Salinivibrio sp. IB574]